ncbi:MAG: CBS domain-containing protein [Chloroflexota bacterium]
MKIRDCMKRNVVSISSTQTIAEAASMVVKRHIGLLPVVDEQGIPIGVVRLNDLISLELPDFINLITDLDFVHDFGAVETTRPTSEVLERPILSLMQPVTVIHENDGLLRTYALLQQNNLSDILVVNTKGKLVGIVSRVDVATAVLSMWSKEDRV